MLDRVKDTLAALSSATKSLTESDRCLRDEYSAVEREEAETLSAFVPVEEQVANMRRRVRDEAARYERDRVRGIVSAFSGRLESTMDADEFREIPAQLYDHRSIFGGGVALGFIDLCGLFPEMVEARLEAIIRNSGLPTGTPLAKRRAAIKAIRARKQAIEDRHTALVDEAATCDPPIVIALLPAVAQRRESARLRAEEAKRAQEARDALERQVDAANRRPRDGMPSQYIQSQGGRLQV